MSTQMATPNPQAQLAQRMSQLLAARQAVRPEQLDDAGRRFRAGALPATAFVMAGVERQEVLLALSGASGIPVAAARQQWSLEPALRTPFADDVWRRARAWPFAADGVAADQAGVRSIAFADPLLIPIAAQSLPPHQAFVCLEDDIESAWLAPRNAGGTLLYTGDGARAASAPPPAAAVPAAGATLGLVDPPPTSPEPVTVPPVARAAAPSARIGPFFVDGVLGQGGMATVYRAHDEQGRHAAVKVIHPHLLSHPEAKARFLREASSTARLHHPNVVEVLEAGSDEGGAWLAVELLEGGSTAELLRRHGRLPTAAAVELFAQMLQGLEAAHAEGIVHRDLKPDNLLLSADGTVKIADFGIAREMDATAMTQTGSTLGTPAYMSPEQACAKPVDGRSDLYTAGVILYELLAGRNPFEGDSVATTVANIINQRVPPLLEVDPTIPESVDALILSLLRYSPNERPKTAGEILASMKPLLAEIRGRHPDLLGSLLKDAGFAARLRQEQARDLVGAARALLQMGAGHREAAALCAFRASLLDPEQADAKRMLEQLEQDQGFSFGSPKNPKIADAEQELVSRPDDPVLLQRLGQLYRQDGNLHKSALYLRRYLRLRPEDAYARTQLSRLAIPAAVPGTMERIAGHIHTAGAIGPLPISLRPAPTAMKVLSSTTIEADSSSAASAALASFSVHKGKLIAAAVAITAVVGSVYAVSAFIEAANRPMERVARSTNSAAHDDEDPKHLLEAQAALTSASYSAAEGAATIVVDHNARPETVARALVLRARARLQQNKAIAAVTDLSRVIDGYQDQDPFIEALVLRGKAYATTGDTANAIADFSRAAKVDGQQEVKAEALLERARLYLGTGRIEEARSDLGWVDTYAKGRELRARLREAKQALPVTAKSDDE